MLERVKLICLCGSDAARADWQAQGGRGILCSEKQLRAMLLIGQELPEPLVFEGTVQAFIDLFPRENATESKRAVNRFLEAGVAAWTETGWDFFTCRAAVLGCCMGEYLSLVNKKEIDL